MGVDDASSCDGGCAETLKSSERSDLEKVRGCGVGPNKGILHVDQLLQLGILLIPAGMHGCVVAWARRALQAGGHGLWVTGGGEGDQHQHAVRYTMMCCGW